MITRLWKLWLDIIFGAEDISTSGPHYIDMSQFDEVELIELEPAKRVEDDS